MARFQHADKRLEVKFLLLDKPGVVNQYYYKLIIPISVDHVRYLKPAHLRFVYKVKYLLMKKNIQFFDGKIIK